ncbi:iron-containing alcohol dehydrogenase [Candidatus Gracilibacteria bacterium]|nr:iron-containing alcohol dehydrogenase [Candidatus Gracilibacteria bacterium]
MQEFFEFYLGARVLFKAGIVGELGDEVTRLHAQRAFIIADRGVVSAGLLEPVLAGMRQSLEIVGVFDDVPANSSVAVVMQAAQQASAAGADVIVAVGGGSPIDTAKCVRILLSNEGHLLDYQGYNVLQAPLVPMIAIPTTAGTGSEVTPFAVIRDEAQDLKITFASSYMVPTLAVLDPLMTASMPARLTAATGADALTHAIECYVSTDRSLFTDSLALHAIELVAGSLATATRHGADLEARSTMLIASCLAGIAFSNGFLGVVHAMAHATGGKFPVHHGTTNAILLPYGMEFNLSAAPQRYARIARALGVDAAGRSDEAVAHSGIAAVRGLLADCGLPARLREIDVPADALDQIAEIALTDAAIFNNPRSAALEDIRAMLQAAW